MDQMNSHEKKKKILNKTFIIIEIENMINDIEFIINNYFIIIITYKRCTCNIK